MVYIVIVSGCGKFFDYKNSGGGSRNIFSEPLEQLASHNGADMYKYNMLYTLKINQDVLTPEPK